MATRPTASNRVGVDEIYAQSTLLDGAADYFSLGTTPTGATDGKVFTISMWFKRANAPTANEMLFAVQGRGGILLKNVGDNLDIEFEDASNVDAVKAETTTLFNDTNWHHLLVSCDVSDTSKRHVYIDGVAESMTWTTYSDLAIDWTKTAYTVGAEVAATFFAGCIAEFYMALEYIDLSAASNRAKFITSESKPANLGTDGSTPTGNAPLFYLNKNGERFGDDQSGNGNDLAENGAPLVCSTSPSD